MKLMYKQIINGSAVSFTSKIIGAILGYLFILILTKNYNINVLGIYTLSLTILQIFLTLGIFGFDITALKLIIENKESIKSVKSTYKKIIILTIIFSGIISVIGYISAPYIAEYIFQKSYLTKYIRIIITAVIPYNLFIINLESLRAFKKIKHFSILFNIIINFFTLVLLYFSFFLYKNSELPSIIYVISVIISSIISFYLLYKHINTIKNTGDKIFNITYKSIFNISIPIFLTEISFLFSTSLMFIILGIYYQPKYIGIFVVFTTIASFISLPFKSTNTITTPMFAEFWKNGEKDKIINTAIKIVNFLLLINIPIILIIILYYNYILRIFSEGINKYFLVLIILIISEFFNTILGPVKNILDIIGEQHYVKRIMLLTIILNSLIVIIFIPKYGILGCAITDAVTLLFWKIILNYKIKSIFGKFIFPRIK